MAVYSEFYKDINFGGTLETFTLDDNWRYYRIHFTGNWNDTISSLRANAYAGFNGNTYAFSDDNFVGKFAALNMDEGWTSWWSYVGDAMNDTISSAILVNRNKNELVINVYDQVAPVFISGMDNALKGTQVSRRGDPRIYSTFWPGYDPTKKFVSIEQDLTVSVPHWFDYDAQVRYDVYLYLDGRGSVQGYVAWIYVWVEGGILSGDIFNSLQPKLVAGASTLTSQLQSLLAAFANFTFSSLYLLPGPPPPHAFGEILDAKSGSTLVLAH